MQTHKLYANALLSHITHLHTSTNFRCSSHSKAVKSKNAILLYSNCMQKLSIYLLFVSWSIFVSFVFPPLFSFHIHILFGVLSFFAQFFFVLKHTHTHIQFHRICEHHFRYRIELIRFSFYVLFSEAVVFESILFIIVYLLILFLCFCRECKYTTRFHLPPCHVSVEVNISIDCSHYSGAYWALSYRCHCHCRCCCLALSLTISLRWMHTNWQRSVWKNKQIVKWLCSEQTRVTLDLRSVNNNAF